jgi:hypothetical protein
MARCLLCSTTVADDAATCPACGGAVAAPATDTWGQTPSVGVDLGKAPPTADPAGTPPPGAYGPAPYPPPGAYGPPPGAYGAPPGYPAPGPYGYGYGYPPRPTENLALAAMITSIAGLVLGFACALPWLACPVGALMGHAAKRRIAENGYQGEGMALTGIICGWIGTGLGVLIFGFYLIFFGSFFALGLTTG